MVIQVLIKGLSISVDQEFWEANKHHNWYIEAGYVRRRIINKRIHMHREVLDFFGIARPAGLVVDHINRQKADNTLTNLRVVSFSVNSKNVGLDEANRRSDHAKNNLKNMTKERTPSRNKASSENIKRINDSGRNRQIGEDNHRSKPVINLESGIISTNLREAAECYGVNYSTLRGRLNGSNPNNTFLRYI